METESDISKQEDVLKSENDAIVNVDDLNEEEKIFLFSYREQPDKQILVEKVLSIYEEEETSEPEGDPENYPIEFITLEPQNIRDCKAFYLMMISYIQELDERKKMETPLVLVQSATENMINLKGMADSYFEVCKRGKQYIGFFYGKLDRSYHKSKVCPGLGFVMEFYVKPEYRRLGYGRTMYQRLEKMLKEDGAYRIRLAVHTATTDLAFWNTMGLQLTGEKSFDETLDFYEKDLIIFPNSPSKEKPAE